MSRSTAGSIGGAFAQFKKRRFPRSVVGLCTPASQKATAHSSLAKLRNAYVAEGRKPGDAIIREMIRVGRGGVGGKGGDKTDKSGQTVGQEGG